MLTSEERRSKLRTWGFNCSCALCQRPAEETVRSDRRRAEVGSVNQNMLALIFQGDFSGAIAMGQGGLKLLEEEDLMPLSSELYESIARVYWTTEDKKSAKAFAGKAVDYRADYGWLEPQNRTAELERLLETFDA